MVAPPLYGKIFTAPMSKYRIHADFSASQPPASSPLPVLLHTGWPESFLCGSTARELLKRRLFIFRARDGTWEFAFLPGSQVLLLQRPSSDEQGSRRDPGKLFRKGPDGFSVCLCQGCSACLCSSEAESGSGQLAGLRSRQTLFTKRGQMWLTGRVGWTPVLGVPRRPGALASFGG